MSALDWIAIASAVASIAAAAVSAWCYLTMRRPK